MLSVPSPDWSELQDKLQALAHVAAQAGCDQLVLKSQANLSYLFGCRSNVPQTLEATCFDVVIEVAGEPRATIVTNTIEAPRLKSTELRDAPVDWDVVTWWQDRRAKLPTGPRVGSDTPMPQSSCLAREVAKVRRSLTAGQQLQLREVCIDAAQAATRASKRLSPNLTEYQAAGVFAGELLDGGMDPIVLLAAGGDRMARDRHPLPTMDRLGPRAMLVCCARRYGLVASVTRIVSFSPLSVSDWSRYDALLNVESAFLDATRSGHSLGEVMSVGTQSYSQHGFDATEWHHHHQGGFTGWEPREFPARLNSVDNIQRNGVVGWNPSGDGWKVEDTSLVTHTGAWPLVADPEWPTRTINGRMRPSVLEV